MLILSEYNTSGKGLVMPRRRKDHYIVCGVDLYEEMQRMLDLPAFGGRFRWEGELAVPRLKVIRYTDWRRTRRGTTYFPGAKCHRSTWNDHQTWQSIRATRIILHVPNSISLSTSNDRANVHSTLLHELCHIGPLTDPWFDRAEDIEGDHGAAFYALLSQAAYEHWGVTVPYVLGSEPYAYDSELKKALVGVVGRCHAVKVPLAACNEERDE